MVKRADALADRFGLRGYDSIHLAAAEALMVALIPHAIQFASVDTELNDAATALVMECLAALQHRDLHLQFNA